jgi:hypothetical protein
VKHLGVATVVIALAVCTLAAADGFVSEIADVSPGRGPVAADAGEDSQRAVILWRDGSETLVIGAGYYGRAANLAWIIPVPGAPTRDGVFLANRSFLDAVFEETAPGRQRSFIRSDTPPGQIETLSWLLPADTLAFSGSKADAPGEATSSVTVRDVFPLGPYQIAILSAHTAADLVTWLREHGFTPPADVEAAVDDYIRRGWSFVAARSTAPDAQARAKPAAAWGELPPLGMRFPAPKATYPLLISRVGARGRMTLRLVVLAGQAVWCDELPLLQLQKQGAKPLSLDVERRVAAENAPSGGLLCEACGELQWLQGRERFGGGPAPVKALPALGEGYPSPDPTGLWATRYWGLLQRDALVDLTFRPVHAWDPFVWNELAISRIHQPWWRLLPTAGPAVLVAWLAATLLLRPLARFVGEIEGAGPLPLPSFGQAALSGLAGVALFAGVAQLAGVLVVPVLIGLLGVGFVLPVLAPLLMSYRIGPSRGQCIGIVAMLATVAVSVLSATAVGRDPTAAIFEVWLPLGALCLLASLLLPASPDAIKRRPRSLWPVATYFGILIGVLAGVGQATWWPVFPVSTSYQGSRQEILTAIGAFRQDCGCLPASLDDLTSATPPKAGVDGSGNPVALTGTAAWHGPYMPCLPHDPTTWRRDTWLYEPTGDMLVEPGKATVSLNQLGPPPASTGTTSTRPRQERNSRTK